LACVAGPSQEVRALPGAERVPPVALLLCGIASVQFGAAFATTLFDRLGASGTSLARVATAAIILIALWRPSVRSLTGRQIRIVVLFGLILGGMNLSFYESLDRIPLGTAVTIEFIGPLGVAVALSRRRIDVAVAIVAAAGVVLVTDPWGDGLDGLGVLFAFVAGLFWGAYVLVADHASGHFSGSDGVALAMVVAALVPLVPGVMQAGTELLDPRMLGLAALVGFFSSVVPYSVETEALRRLPARVFSVLMSLEPAVAALAGLVVLGQRLAAPQLLGVALVVVASVTVTRPAAAPEA
jgi:inner membrane transporter RhtA